MVKMRNFKKKWLLIPPLFLLWLFGCYHHVGFFETNQVWMMYFPPNNAYVSPHADKNDPNILYLLEIGKEGKGKRVDLQIRTITDCQFEFPKNYEDTWTGEFERKRQRSQFVQDYDRADDYGLPNMPASEEFRGRTLSHPTFHLYGYPFASEPGIRKAEPQFGYWYILDTQQGRKVELLRIRVWNAENPTSRGLGYYYISPDKKWGVFRSEDQKVYIFNREAPRPEKF